jgi:two-component sensor histidine kinase
MRDLRVRFSLILAVALLPSLIFSVWHSLQDFRSETAARQFNVLQSTRALETEVGETINTGKALLRSIGTRQMSSACELDLEGILDEFGRFDELDIFDAQGQFLCSAQSPQVSARFDPATPPLPYDGGITQFQMGDPFHIYSQHSAGSAPDRQSYLVVSHAFFHQDTVREIYRLKTDASRLRALKNSILSGTDTRAAIVTRSGNILISNAAIFDAVEPEWLDIESDGGILERHVVWDSGEMQTLYILATRAPNIFITVSQTRPDWIHRTLINPVSALFIPLLGWVFAFVAIWMATDRLLLSHLKRLSEAALDFAEGRFDRRVGTLDEAPKQLRELASAFDLMADGVSQRDEDLNRSLKEKEILLREIHHRVKNNLQIIISLLNIQKRELKNPVYNEAIDETRNRINAIALVHKALYESDNIEDVPMGTFLSQLIGQAARTLGVERKGITVKYHITLEPRTGDRAISIAMFIMEAMTNAVKHGVPNGGTITIKAIDGDENSLVSVTDTGNGPKFRHQSRGADTNNISPKPGTGSRLMEGFARQLSGTYATSLSKNGFVCQLTFPKEI